MNPDASPAILARFATDRFWSVRIAVAEHPNTARGTLLTLLEPNPARRGVVHHAARERLERDGVRFGEDAMPLSPTTERRPDPAPDSVEASPKRGRHMGTTRVREHLSAQGWTGEILEFAESERNRGTRGG